MEKQIIESAKQNIIKIVDSLEVSNIDQVYSDVVKYLDFAKAYSQLPHIINGLNEVSEEANEPNQSNVVNLSGDTIQLHTENKVEGYEFKRNIKGGYLDGADIYVPEKFIRELGLQHGDIVKADKIGEKRYKYTVLDDCGCDSLSDVISIKMAVVEYDPSSNRYTASKDWMDNPIMINGHEAEIIISDNDFRNFSIMTGDIIDISVDKNDLDFSRVVWKHATTDEYNRQYTSSIKREPKKPIIEKKKHEQFFAGKKIVMVGFDVEKASFRDAVERHGGQFECLHGMEDESRFEAIMKDADAVVLMLSFVKHRATILANQLCKDNGIPCDSLHTKGKSGFVRMAKELIDKKAKEVHVTLK